MRPAAFDYVAPTSLDQALAVLSEAGGDARPIAGGQSLVPMMNLRLAQPERVVDLRRITELRGIEARADSVRIGAMTTHAEVEESEELARALPLLAAVACEIGHPPVRSRGTIGGSVAHADPTAEWPVVLATLGALVHVVGPSGTRAVPAREFFLGYFMTALETGEIVSAVEIPRLEAGTGWSFREFARQPGAFALVSVVALAALDGDGAVGRLVAGLGSCAPAPVVFERDRPALGDADADGASFGHVAAEIAAEIEDPPADIHAASADRREIARALLEDALSEAAGRAGRCP